MLGSEFRIKPAVVLVESIAYFSAQQSRKRLLPVAPLQNCYRTSNTKPDGSKIKVYRFSFESCSLQSTCASKRQLKRSFRRNRALPGDSSLPSDKSEASVPSFQTRMNSQFVSKSVMRSVRTGPNLTQTPGSIQFRQKVHHLTN
jgi:hypothetical protein